MVWFSSTLRHAVRTRGLYHSVTEVNLPQQGHGFRRDI
jgi:hypothetical protein